MNNLMRIYQKESQKFIKIDNKSKSMRIMIRTLILKKYFLNSWESNNWSVGQDYSRHYITTIKYLSCFYICLSC